MTDIQHVDIPSDWRAFAESLGLVDVMEIWRGFCAWMSSRGHEPSQEAWARWCRRRAPKVARETPKLRVWRPPPDWTTDRATLKQAIEAARAIVDGKVWKS